MKNGYVAVIFIYIMSTRRKWISLNVHSYQYHNGQSESFDKHEWHSQSILPDMEPFQNVFQPLRRPRLLFKCINIIYYYKTNDITYLYNMFIFHNRVFGHKYISTNISDTRITTDTCTEFQMCLWKMTKSYGSSRYLLLEGKCRL